MNEHDDGFISPIGIYLLAAANVENKIPEIKGKSLKITLFIKLFEKWLRKEISSD